MTSEKSTLIETAIKEGIHIRDGILYVRGIDYIERIATLLSLKTRLEILQILREKELSMKELAKLTGQSKANISAQIKKLEENGLVTTYYKRGVRGVKKLCKTNIREIRILLY